MTAATAEHVAWSTRLGFDHVAGGAAGVGLAVAVGSTVGLGVGGSVGDDVAVGLAGREAVGAALTTAWLGDEEAVGPGDDVRASAPPITTMIRTSAPSPTASVPLGRRPTFVPPTRDVSGRPSPDWRSPHDARSPARRRRDGELEARGTRESHDGLDVIGVGDSDDDGRSTIDATHHHDPCLVVLGVVRLDDPAVDDCAKIPDRGRRVGRWSACRLLARRFSIQRRWRHATGDRNRRHPRGRQRTLRMWRSAANRWPD